MLENLSVLVKNHCVLAQQVTKLTVQIGLVFELRMGSFLEEKNNRKLLHIIIQTCVVMLLALCPHTITPFIRHHKNLTGFYLCHYCLRGKHPRCICFDSASPVHVNTPPLSSSSQGALQIKIQHESFLAVFFHSNTALGVKQ